MTIGKENANNSVKGKVAVKKARVGKKKAEIEIEVRKIILLDTNVPLFDPKCTRKFENNDVHIPLCSIEELDHKKNGNDSKNYNAREFSRLLDSYTKDAIFNGGVSLGKGFGNLKIEHTRPFHEKVKANLHEDSIDNKIINIAYYLKLENPNRQVILVSKDTNVRLKAKALGILAQDFLSEKLENINFLSEAVKIIKPKDTIIRQLRDSKAVDYSLKTARPNQNYILEGTSGEVLARYFNGRLLFVNKDHYAFNIKPKNSEQAFALDALLDPSIEVVTLEGGPGTGKTIMSLAAGFEQYNNGPYEQIIFTRKLITVGKDMGFLPGDVNDKMAPYMEGMFKTIKKLHTIISSKSKNKNPNTENKDQKLLSNCITSGVLNVVALSFIRGTSIDGTFYIVDEAQNLTPLDVKTIITRAGAGTKMIFIGDIHQIDDPLLDERSNGFSYLIDRYKGQENYAHISLKMGERSYVASQGDKLL